MIFTNKLKRWLQKSGALILALLVCSAFTVVPAEAQTLVESDERTPQLTDPTQPNWFGVGKKSAAPKGPVLNSLVTGPQRRIAVINGDLMREGDTRHGITIEEILDDRVLIRNAAGKKKVLKLRKSNYPVKIPRENKR